MRDHPFLYIDSVLLLWAMVTFTGFLKEHLTGRKHDKGPHYLPRSSTYHGGYTYGVYSGNTANKIHLRCSGYRSTGCRGKGYMIKGKGVESFVLTDEHSHPPNFLMERRSEIAKTLKEFAVTIPGKPIEVYNSVVSIYPEVEQIWPFSRAVRTINRIRQRTGFMRTSSSS